MDQSTAGVLWRLGGVFALVLANGFFVAAEFSIVTVRKTRIDQLIAEGHRGARAVRRAISAPESYIAATQLGITMASLGLGWVGEPAVASMLQPSLSFLPVTIAEATSHSIAVAVAFALVTALHIVLGELAPKSIALERAEATALLVVKPTELFMKVFSPFIWLLNGTGQAVVRLLGLRRAGKLAMVHSEEELKMLVTASQEAGVLEEQEEQMLHRVFGFADLTAGQVMVPRTEIIAIDVDAPRDDVIALVARHEHPRLPVYRGDLDHVVGILHATDLVRVLAAHNDGPLNLAALAREVLTVPETLGAGDLLSEMRRRSTREALVIDEYGGTAGLVTFERLMTRIVGDIGPGIAGGARVQQLADGSAVIDGLVLIRDVNEQFGLHIDETTYTTVGGFVLGVLGRRPKVGDAIDIDDRRMGVEALDGIRVAKVRLSRPPESRGENTPAAPGEE